MTSPESCRPELSCSSDFTYTQTYICIFTYMYIHICILHLACAFLCLTSERIFHKWSIINVSCCYWNSAPPVDKGFYEVSVWLARLGGSAPPVLPAAAALCQWLPWPRRWTSAGAASGCGRSNTADCAADGVFWWRY